MSVDSAHPATLSGEPEPKEPLMIAAQAAWGQSRHRAQCVDGVTNLRRSSPSLVITVALEPNRGASLSLDGGYLLSVRDTRLHASYGKGITDPTFFEQFGSSVDFPGNSPSKAGMRARR